MKFYFTDYHDKFDPVTTVMVYFVVGFLILMTTVLVSQCQDAAKLQKENFQAAVKACTPLKVTTYYNDVLTGSLMVVCADNTIKKGQ